MLVVALVLITLVLVVLVTLILLVVLHRGSLLSLRKYRCIFSADRKTIHGFSED